MLTQSVVPTTFVDEDKSTGAMNKQKRQFGFRVKQPLADDIISYKEANNLSQSDALRELVSKGLRADKIEEQLQEHQERIERLEAQQTSSGLFSFLR
jgi:hypothetical protein